MSSLELFLCRARPLTVVLTLLSRRPIPQRASEMVEKNKATLSSRTTKSTTALKKYDGGDGGDDSSDEDSEDNGGLVLVKKKRAAGGDGEKDDAGSHESDGSESERMLERNKKKGTKMRITRDGVAATAVSLATKKVFDEDGEAMVSDYSDV